MVEVAGGVSPTAAVAAANVALIWALNSGARIATCSARYARPPLCPFLTGWHMIAEPASPCSAQACSIARDCARFSGSSNTQRTAGPLLGGWLVGVAGVGSGMAEGAEDGGQAAGCFTAW